MQSAVAPFRHGLAVSINGSPWGPSRTVALTEQQCAASTTSLCAAGTPAVIVDVRWPTVRGGVDLTRVHTQLGEAAGAAGFFYEIRLVRSTSSPTCAGGFLSPAVPYTNNRVVVNVANPSPAPYVQLLCQWTALMGVPDRTNRNHVILVWSDTVTAAVVRAP
jgi:hypothetical protein